MKPFNLEQAKQGKKVVTRDGIEVKDLSHLPSASGEYKLIGTVDGEIESWLIDGYTWTSKTEHHNNLFMATEKKTVWVNVYESQLGNTAYDVSHAYDTKNIAIANGRTHRKEYIGTYPIEIEV